MAMTSRTKKRLALAIAVLLVGGVAVPGAYVLRRAQKQQSIEQALEEGLAAHESEDHATAIKRLRYYVSAERFNDEANLALARSLSVAGASSPEFLLQAIDHALRVTSDEHREDAAALVLKLYAQAGKTSETLQAAERLYAIDDENYDALSAKAAVLLALRRWEDAAEAAHEFREKYPGDLDAHTLWFHTNLTRPEDGRPSIDALREDLEAVYAAHEGDLRFGLLRFDVLLRMDLVEEAIAALRESAEQGDITNVKPEQLQYFSGPIHRLVNLARDPEIRAAAKEARDLIFGRALEVPELAQRAGIELAVDAWTRGETDDARSHLDRAVSPPESAPTEAIGWSMLLGATDEAIAAELEQRRGPDAEFWRDLIEAARLVDQGEFDRAETTIREHADGGDHAWLAQFFIGQARMLRGDVLAAADAFELSVLRSPRGPYYLAAARLAEAMFEAGMYGRALEVASDAGDLSGDQRVMEVLPKSIALLGGAGMLAPEYRRQLATSMARGLAQPGLSATAATHMASMSLALDREDLAIQAATATLENADTGDAGALAEAARLMIPVDPDLSDRLLEKAVAEDPDHPSVLLTRASKLAIAGDEAGGIDLIEQRIDAAPEGEQDALAGARARFLSQFMPQRLEVELIEQAEQSPDDAAAQLRALATNSLWSDDNARESTRKAIDRLKSIVGEDGLVWRPHEARWILSFAEDQASRVRTEVLGPLLDRENPDSRVLILAAEARYREAQSPDTTDQQARLRMNEAISLYERAASGDQPMPAIALRTIRMLQQLGLTAEAETRLRFLDSLSSLSLPQRVELAELYERQGLFAEAARTLAATIEPGAPSGRWAALGRLWARAGENRRAEQAFSNVVDDEQAGAPAVVEAATFFAATGDRQRAESLLESLAGRLAPDQARRARAEFLARIDEDEQAEEILSELAQQDPAHAARLVGFYAERVRTEDFDRALAEAIQRFPDDNQLKALQARRLAAEGGSGDGIAPDVAAVASLMRQRKQISADEMVRRLNAIVARFPGSRAARTQLVRLLREEGRLDEALDAAQQAATVVTADPSIASLAALVAYESGDPRTALTYAQEWRRRSRPDTEEPDRLIAAIQVDLGQARDALAWARANQSAAEEQATVEAPELVSQVGTTLVAAGDTDAARAMAERLTARDPQWAAISLVWLAKSVPPPDVLRPWLLWVQQTAEQTPETRRMLASLWYANAGQEEETQSYQQVVDLLGALGPDELTADDSARLAASYGGLGRFDDAATWYDHAIGLTSDNPNALVLNNAAYNDWQRGAVDQQSLDRITLALELIRPILAPLASGGSTLASLLDTKGLILISLGQAEEAASTYDEALSLGVDKPDLHVGRAEALVALGRTEEARTELAVAKGMPEGIDEELRARIEGLESQL